MVAHKPLPPFLSIVKQAFEQSERLRDSAGCCKTIEISAIALPEPTSDGPCTPTDRIFCLPSDKTRACGLQCIWLRQTRKLADGSKNAQTSDKVTVRNPRRLSHRVLTIVDREMPCPRMLKSIRAFIMEPSGPDTIHALDCRAVEVRPMDGKSLCQHYDARHTTLPLYTVRDLSGTAIEMSTWPSMRLSGDETGSTSPRRLSPPRSVQNATDRILAASFDVGSIWTPES